MTQPFRVRRATADDSRRAFDVFIASARDLTARKNKELSLELPMVNEIAMRHLLHRGFRIDPFYSFLMSNRPFGQFDRYIGFSPPFLL